MADMVGGDFESSPAKRQKLNIAEDQSNGHNATNTITGQDINGSTLLTQLDGSADMRNISNSQVTPRRGEAPVKAEYRITSDYHQNDSRDMPVDDDEAEKSTMIQSGAKESYVGKNDRNGGRGGRGGRGDKKKERGQNKGRTYGNWGDSIRLCNSRQHADEFAPISCSYGEKCKLEHDIRKYLSDGKEPDLQTYGGICPVWAVRGVCDVGWKCRFVASHSTERTLDDGRKELVLVEDEARKEANGMNGSSEETTGVYNVVTAQQKIDLSKRKVETPRADQYTEWLSNAWNEGQAFRHNHKLQAQAQREAEENSTTVEDADEASRDDDRAAYIEPPFLPSEKRRLYYGAETPVLAPLTTQGNLPFRRLCVELGAQVTWSEMGMGLPIIQGNKPEWALMKAHQTEITPPKCNNPEIVTGYDHSKDLKFGVQIAANKPWLAFKTTEILASHLPHLRAIDLNCGCPIDLVYKQGAGSALLDSHSRLEKMLRGMNTLSGEIPITVKIRMGTRDSQPTADSLISRLVLGGADAQQAGLGPCGVAAITLHGRSRQQRYTKLANWEYIADCAALVNRIHKEQDDVADTIKEPDTRQLANGGKVFFMGNGDCYSHVDYYTHIESGKVDSVMVARGALIKPWLFEEIESQQYLDKSASERLTYIEKFVRYGLETWGSDETGVGTTRRFLLEWLGFACRYVPLGILEHLPPKINERPPRFKGRNEMETLLSSDNYKDWLKISEMFLGPPHKDFRFAPKHKSNSYEIEAEG